MQIIIWRLLQSNYLLIILIVLILKELFFILIYHAFVYSPNFYLYRHILDLLFLTPNDKIEYELKECYKINETCGVDLDTLKRLVSMYLV